MLDLILLALIAGVLSFLAPCTLPVLPAYLAFAAAPTRAGTLSRTLAFGTGLLLVFVALGTLAGSLGSLVGTNKNVITRSAGAAFILLGALVLAGRELPGFRSNAAPDRTIAGSFLFGTVFALSWSGCIGPVLGFALLLAAQTQTAIQGGVLLAAYAIGLIAPLLAVSAFLDRRGRFLRVLRGRNVTIAGREYHTTQLITGAMLVIVGLVFLFRLDAILARSPVIGWIYRLENGIAAAFRIPLQP